VYLAASGQVWSAVAVAAALVTIVFLKSTPPGYIAPHSRRAILNMLSSRVKF
jgi:hypothetical protein